MMYNYDKSYETEGGMLKSLVWICAVGLASYALYRLISEPDMAREVGEKVRGAARKVREKVDETAEQVKQGVDVRPELAETTT